MDVTRDGGVIKTVLKEGSGPLPARNDTVLGIAPPL